MRILAFFGLFVFLALLSGTTLRAGEATGLDRTGTAVIREMNLARQHPDLYASILERRPPNT